MYTHRRFYAHHSKKIKELWMWEAGVEGQTVSVLYKCWHMPHSHLQSPKLLVGVVWSQYLFFKGLSTNIRIEVLTHTALMYVHGKHREKSNNNSSIIHAKTFLLLTCTNTYLQNSNGIFLPEFWVMRDNGRHAGEVVSFHFLQRRKFILGAQVHHIGKPPESKQGLRQ